MANPSKEVKAKEPGAQQTEPTRAVAVPRTAESVGMAPHRGGAAAPYRGWEPFDRMVEQFFRGWPALWAGVGRDWHWGLDVHESDGEIVVRAEAPGFEPGDFDIQVRGDQLVLRASHRAEAEEKDRGYHEWSRQEFYRSVPLPAGIDPDKVAARYRNGVLAVTLPKTEESKGRRIAVQG